MESVVFVKNGVHYSLNDGSKTLEEYHKKFGDVSIVDTNTILEIKWMDIKNKRDRLITNTDWTQVPDSPLSAEKMTEFVKYRQLLRDIPQTYADPDSIVWPTMPSI